MASMKNINLHMRCDKAPVFDEFMFSNMKNSIITMA